MTLPPERIGDKGQRFEIRGRRAEDGVEIAIGWCTEREAADKLASSMRHWPYLDGQPLVVVDRQKAPT